MTRKLLALALAGAVASLLLTACGGDIVNNNTPDSGATSWVKTCTTTNDCATGEMCHPIGKICVKTCTQTSDCTEFSSALCDEVRDSGGTSLSNGVKVCTCTSTSCATGDACSYDSAGVDIDGICEPKCSSSPDCGAFTGQTRICDTRGICVFAPAGCTTDSTCTSPSASKCNAGTGVCVACTVDAECTHLSGGLTKCNNGTCQSPGTSCDPLTLDPGANGGPDNCSYGQVCSGTTCGTGTVANGGKLPDDSCTAAGTYSWTKSLKGPVIITADWTGFDTSDPTKECANGLQKAEVTVTFYEPGNGFTHGNMADFLANGVTFVKPDGTKVQGAFARTVPTSGATSGTMVIGTCGIKDITGRALYLTDSDGNGGNAVCL